MGLDPDVADAMGDGPSYIRTVREAFDRLVAWVERGEAPPPSQTVPPGRGRCPLQMRPGVAVGFEPRHRPLVGVCRMREYALAVAAQAGLEQHLL